MQPLVDVALHGDRGGAITPLHERLFHPDLRAADLLERNHAPVAGREGEVGEPGRIEALGAGAASDHIDGANVLADLRNGDASKKELELPAHLRWREADEVQSILIRDEAEHGCAITPIAVGLPHVLNAPHNAEGLFRNRCLMFRILERIELLAAVAGSRLSTSLSAA